jgi:ankyrin repeat protein
VRKAKKLLEAGADLTARDEHLRSTPLAWAAKFGQVKMVEFLLGHGAPTNLPDDPEWATPLAWATRRGHDEIVRLLS